MATNLKEKILKSELIFTGRFLKVWRDEVELPNGHHSFREYIKHPGAACIVPVLDNGNLVMIKQYRHAVGEIFLEFPAGKADRGEKTETTAIRELEEETGYRAGHVELLTKIHPVIGYSNEAIDIYLAKNLVMKKAHHDPDELLELIEISPADLQEKIWQGEVTDVKTQIAAFWFLKKS